MEQTLLEQRHFKIENMRESKILNCMFIDNVTISGTRPSELQTPHILASKPV